MIGDRVGDRVIYVLSANDAAQINRRRTNGASITERMKQDYQTSPRWPEGAQAHIGNNVAEGMRFPGVVVRDWIAETEASDAGLPDNPAVNLQVWLDGNDTFWATSRHEDASKSPKPGTFARA